MSDGGPTVDELGWDAGWAAALRAAAPDGQGGRVLVHHGVALVMALPDGLSTITLTHRLDPEPTVGDWVAIVEGEAVGVLERRSLLRRRTAHGEGTQQLAANIDTVLLVCGLDRPVKDGRIARGVALARDAGAEAVVVLTKAAGGDDPVQIDQAVAEVRSAHPGLDVVVTSVEEGHGLDELRAVIGSDTVTLLGESGAGKSSIVNALVGVDIAATGAVRESDAKGRHTTTSRELHVLPSGGVLIDTPGIRSVGLLPDQEEGMGEDFADLEERAEECRFADCQHQGQPGCAIAAGIADGTLDTDRVARWQSATTDDGASDSDRPPTRRRR